MTHDQTATDRPNAPAKGLTDLVCDPSTGRITAGADAVQVGLRGARILSLLLDRRGTIVPQAFWGVSVRGARYKVAQLDTGQQAFFDLQTDPYEHTNLLGAPISSTNLTPAQLLAYTGLTNRLANCHNVPVAPQVAVSTSSNALHLTVTEQLGIAYALERTRNLQTQPWTLVTNYVREIAAGEPSVKLSDPSPVVPPVFYRVSSSGR